MDRPRSPDLAARLFGDKPEHTLALLRAIWPSAVGEELARRTRPVAYDSGVLRVMVPDLRWQRSLLRMRGDILSRLRRVAGRASPRSLGFVTGEVTDPAPPRDAPRLQPSQPVPAIVVEAADAIAEESLRKPFLEAAGRYLARFAPQAAGSGTGPSADAESS
jgi:hypothetical protein